MNRIERQIANAKQNKIELVKSQPSVNSLREGQEVVYITKDNRLSRYRKERGRLWVSDMSTSGDQIVDRNIKINGRGDFKGDVRFSGSTGTYSLWDASEDRYTLANPTGAPTLRLLRNDDTVATGESLGKIEFAGLDDEEDVGCMIEGQSRGTWDGGSDIPSSLIFWVADDNTTTLREHARFSWGSTTFNEQGYDDIDFRVESNTVQNALKVSASDDILSSACVKVALPNLPTSDPGVAGQLWNDSGDLKVSV